MAQSPNDAHTAYELLQEWRQLERRLEQLAPDAGDRPEVEQQRDASRDRYLSRFDTVVREARES